MYYSIGLPVTVRKVKFCNGQFFAGAPGIYITVIPLNIIMICKISYYVPSKIWQISYSKSQCAWFRKHTTYHNFIIFEL